MSKRSDRERVHGVKLASGDTETIWGWGTPAGKLRARRRGELIASAAELGPGRNVLEIGCGTGLFTEMFSEYGAELLACDISEDLLEKAGQRGLEDRNVRFVCAQFEACDIDGPFDAVIGSSILHHLELGPALVKIRSLLKPGGLFAFAEPNMRNPQVFAERKFRRLFPNISPDETAFTRAGITRSLREAGFSDIEVTPFDWLHPSTPEALIPLVRGLGRLLETTPLLREFSGSLCIRARRA